MMKCPKCGMEYRDGFTQCSDCLVPLVPYEEPEEDQITCMHPVKLTTVSNGTEAEMAVSLLKDSGIQVMRRPLESGGYMKICMGFSIYGEELYVAEADYERAAELLEVLEPGGVDETKENDADTDEESDADEACAAKPAHLAVRIIILAGAVGFAVGLLLLLVSSATVFFQTL